MIKVYIAKAVELPEGIPEGTPAHGVWAPRVGNFLSRCLWSGSKELSDSCLFLSLADLDNELRRQSECHDKWIRQIKWQIIELHEQMPVIDEIPTNDTRRIDIDL